VNDVHGVTDEWLGVFLEILTYDELKPGLHDLCCLNDVHHKYDS
jgi:hypothetical protein